MKVFYTNLLQAMRIKLEQALNSEMMLKMQLESKMKPRSQSPCRGPPCVPSTSSGRESNVLVAALPTPSSQLETRTTTFYTEVTVRVSVHN